MKHRVRLAEVLPLPPAPCPPHLPQDAPARVFTVRLPQGAAVTVPSGFDPEELTVTARKVANGSEIMLRMGQEDAREGAATAARGGRGRGAVGARSDVGGGQVHSHGARGAEVVGDEHGDTGKGKGDDESDVA